MNKSQQERRRKLATQHRILQRIKKDTSLAESTEAAKRSKKGKKGVVAEMEKRGYRPDGKGGWKRLAKQEG